MRQRVFQLGAALSSALKGRKEGAFLSLQSTFSCYAKETLSLPMVKELSSLTISPPFPLIFDHWTNPLGSSFEGSCAFTVSSLSDLSPIQRISKCRPGTSRGSLLDM